MLEPPAYKTRKKIAEFQGRLQGKTGLPKGSRQKVR